MFTRLLSFIKYIAFFYNEGRFRGTRIQKVIVALEELLAAIIFNKSSNVTVSTYMETFKQDGQTYGMIYSKAFDFIEKDHTYLSLEAEIEQMEADLVYLKKYLK